MLIFEGKNEENFLKAITNVEDEIIVRKWFLIKKGGER